MAPDSYRPDGEGSGLDRRSTAQSVAAAVREQLLRGELGPGMKLNDHVLAASFNVSRNSVREAMQILVSEGLVRQNLHHGAVVAELGLDELTDIYRARRALELAGIRAARTADAGWLEQIHRVLSDMDAAAARQDSQGVLDADRQFHAALILPIGSDRINRTYRTIQTQIRLTRAWYGERASPPVFYQRHAEIVEALDARDYARADGLLGAVLDDGEARLRKELLSKAGVTTRVSVP